MYAQRIFRPSNAYDIVKIAATTSHRHSPMDCGPYSEITLEFTNRDGISEGFTIFVDPKDGEKCERLAAAINEIFNVPAPVPVSDLAEV